MDSTRRPESAGVFLAVLLTLASPTAAQTAVPSPSPDTQPKNDPAATRPAAPRWHWFEIDVAQLSSRYREIEDSAGWVGVNQLQERTQLRARVNLDARNRLALNAGVFSGTAFTGGWNATGLGSGGTVTNLKSKVRTQN